MKRLIVLCVVVAALLLPASAQARTNYRPWKEALQRAYEVYTNADWLPRAQAGEGLTSPWRFAPNVNKWGWDSCVMGTLVTSLYGAFPNGEWGAEMRAFLKPFRTLNDMQLAALYHPPIRDLRMSP